MARAKTADATKKKSAPSHPPYAEMITDAIVTLKERTGSSQQAISKFMEEKHKQLPSNFRKLLLNQLKKLVASGKLTKVKNSFKLPPAAKVKSEKPNQALAKPSGPVKTKPTPKPARNAKATTAKDAPKQKARVKTKATAKPAAQPRKSKAASAKDAAKPTARVKSKATPKPDALPRKAGRSSKSAPAKDAARPTSRTKSKPAGRSAKSSPAKAAAKPKAGGKRKAAEKPKAGTRKSARTATVTSPAKKAAKPAARNARKTRNAK